MGEADHRGGAEDALGALGDTPPSGYRATIDGFGTLSLSATTLFLDTGSIATATRVWDCPLPNPDLLFFLSRTAKVG